MSLPSGYTKLGYIQSDGSQYIDTGFIPNQDTRLIIDFEPVSVASTHIFGSRTASSGSDAFVTLVTGGVYRDDYYNDKVSTSVAPGGRITIDKNKNVTTVGSASVNHTYTTFNGTYQIALFANNTGGTISYYSSYKLYSCKIYDNGTLVRDFIPAKNTAGVAGLWDDVNSVFYTDAAGGSFIDPSIPVGDHNTIIGGVAYKIEGGRVLLGGVEYELEKGLVMVDGVVREIVFASKLPVVITISGELSNYRYATINGTKITTTGTYEYTEMPTISVYLNAVESSGSQYTRVSLNGTVVQKGTGTYTLNTEDRNITIKFGKNRDVSEDRTYLYAIITTS